MSIKLPDVMPMPVPADVKDLQKIEGRYRRDDGKVTKDEALALLRQAGKDGTVSKEEMGYLRSRLNDTSFTPEAREAVGRFVSLSGGQAETGDASSAKTIGELRDTYAQDDGKIDRGELKAIMRDAMSSGRTLDRAEVKQLHELAKDPRLTEGAKKDLEALLRFFPKPEAMPRPVPLPNWPPRQLPPNPNPGPFPPPPPVLTNPNPGPLPPQMPPQQMPPPQQLPPPGGMDEAGYLAQLQAMQAEQQAIATAAQKLGVPPPGRYGQSTMSAADYLSSMKAIQDEKGALESAMVKGDMGPSEYVDRMRTLRNKEYSLEIRAGAVPNPDAPQAGGPSAPPAGQDPMAALQSAVQQLQDALSKVQSGAADALSDVLSKLAQQIRDMGTSSRITTLANRYRGDDGKITSDEAKAILREAGKDGGLSTATQRQLAAMMMFDPSLTSGARRELARVVGPSLDRSTTESKTSNVDTLRSIAKSYRDDDGKIDRGELRQILSEALRNGGALARQEVDFLRTLSRSPSMTPAARTELGRFLDAFPPPQQRVAIYA